jgi:large subunit ribosomal protein L18
MSTFLTSDKTIQRKRRHQRIRSRVEGTATMPRLCVFRSNRNIYAQLIDDRSGSTLASSHDMKDTVGTKVERAQKVGTAIAQAAKVANITKVVFDRGGFKYTGRIQALADAARAAGLQF